jgi:Fibronectin type III domain
LSISRPTTLLAGLLLIAAPAISAGLAQGRPARHRHPPICRAHHHPRNCRARRRARSRPTAPTRLVARVSGTRVRLSWGRSRDAHSRIVGYYVYRDRRRHARPRRTTFLDKNLRRGRTYRYYVRARDAGGRLSAASKVVSATISAPRGPTRGAPPTSAPTPGGTVSGGVLYGGGAFGEGNWPPGNWVPYGPSSPFNQALPAPSQTPLDANSANVVNYINTQFAQHSFLDNTISNTPAQDDPSQWMHPLYWAKWSDPWYTIKATQYGCAVGVNASECPTRVQIPNGAQHALAGDGHLAVVQPDGHTEVDFWQVQNPNPISGGGTLSASSYGALDLNGSGCCSNATAAHQGLAAGQIRGPELAAGVIQHALIVTMPCSDGKYVYPATGTTSTCSNATNAPPLGARFQLNETDAQIASQNVPPYVKVIEKAMEHYGVYFTDNNGGGLGLAVEPALDYVSFGSTADTVMTYLKTLGLSDPASLVLRTINPANLQVVAVCYTRRTC